MMTNNKEKWVAFIFIPEMKMFKVEVAKWDRPYADIPMLRIEAKDGTVYLVPIHYVALMKEVV